MLRADRAAGRCARPPGCDGGMAGWREWRAFFRRDHLPPAANRKPAHLLAHKKRSKEPWPETRKQQGRERTSSPPRTVSTRGRRTRADRPRHPSELRIHVQQMLPVLVLSPRHVPHRIRRFKTCIPSHAVIIYLYTTAAAVALSWCGNWRCSVLYLTATSIRSVLGGMAVWAIRMRTTQFHSSGNYRS